MNGKKHIISAAKVTLALAVSAAISLSCDKKETESPLPEPSQPEKAVEFEIKASDVTTESGTKTEFPTQAVSITAVIIPTILFIHKYII